MAVAPASAGMSVGFTYATKPADIRVWMEADDVYHGGSHYEGAGYDVYPSVEEVVLNVRVSRSTYAAVYVVDTAGFIHVVYPLSPYDNTYLRAGRVYRFYLSDFDISGDFDRGVAYAFAVSSPVGFSFQSYGWGIFAGNLGFQVYGDPYIAARRFYMNILPSSCNLEVVGVSHARFYLREYVRYPSYLCVGWHDYAGARRYCRAGCEVYKHYSVHAKDPYRALRPVGEPRRMNNGAKIVRTGNQTRFKADDVRIQSESKPFAYETPRPVRTPVTRSVHNPAVVKSSKNSFVQGKKDLSAMRKQLAKREKREAKAAKNAEKGVSNKTQEVARAKSTSKSSDDGKKSQSKRKDRHGSR